MSHPVHLILSPGTRIVTRHDANRIGGGPLIPAGAVAGWPVQFLPPGPPLVEEALRESVSRNVDGTPARVFTAEHLAAIALQTGRAKDKARLLQFIEAGALAAARFQAILARHDLVDRWRQFERQFLTP